MSEDGETSHAQFQMPPLEELKACVLDLSRPIAQRMRSIFYLRTVGGDEAVATLCKALHNKEGTTLFRHEIAYVLGQMEAKSAIQDLVEVLQDPTDDPIVRHESGEALGAIADPSVLPILEKHCTDERSEVAETCQIAVRRVRWVMEHGDNPDAEATVRDNPYESIDPAPASKAPTREQLIQAAADLINPALPLFERYKAMFSLRNNGTKAAVLALCKGLKDESPLFRHEVAYVLGQLAHDAAATALMEAVQRDGEHDMVRHEAAEALGAIGTGECVDFLKKYAADEVVMLRESCEVALDVVDYWSTAAEGLTAGAGAEAESKEGATATA